MTIEQIAEGQIAERMDGSFTGRGISKGLVKLTREGRCIMMPGRQPTYTKVL